MLDLEPIKARLAADDIGPAWEAGGPTDWPDMFEDQAYVFPAEGSNVGGPICLASSQARAALIAHAPADLAALVAEVETLRADYAALRVLYDAAQELRIAMREAARASSPARRQAAERQANQEWRTVRALLERLALDEQHPGRALPLGSMEARP